MKKSFACLLATVFLFGTSALASAQERRLVGSLNRDINNPGCYFYFANRRLMFYDSDETWMNIDGRDVRLSLVKQTRPKGRMRTGSRSTKSYSAGDITVDIVEVITKFSSISNLSATFTVRKGNRTQVVRGTGVCGD
jgi:hypothetical protein